MQTFWDQVERFDDPNYFTDEELETAKQVLRTQILYRSEQLSTFAQDLSFWWASAGLDYYEKYLDNLMKINRKDIREYIHRYIHGKPYVLGVALSQEATRKLKLDMKKLGPSKAKP